MAELKMDEFVKNVGQKVAEDIKQKYIERAVLDKIRDEIEEHTDGNNHCDEYLDGYNNGMKDALEIIDKYTKGAEK